MTRFSARPRVFLDISRYYIPGFSVLIRQLSQKVVEKFIRSISTVTSIEALLKWRTKSQERKNCTFRFVSTLLSFLKIVVFDQRGIDLCLKNLGHRKFFDYSTLEFNFAFILFLFCTNTCWYTQNWERYNYEKFKLAKILKFRYLLNPSPISYQSLYFFCSLEPMNILNILHKLDSTFLLTYPNLTGEESPLSPNSRLNFQFDHIASNRRKLKLKDNKDRWSGSKFKKKFRRRYSSHRWNIIENTWREDGSFLLHRISINIGTASAIQWSKETESAACHVLEGREEMTGVGWWSYIDEIPRVRETCVKRGVNRWIISSPNIFKVFAWMRRLIEWCLN